VKALPVLGAGLLAASAAMAQAPGPAEQAACEQAREGARAVDDAGLQAAYANCLIMGALRERDALPHARELARASMKQGSPTGAFALYAAYSADPAYSYIKGGKPDMTKYAALGALPIESRKLQVEALEALGFAASKAYPRATQALAAYYFETVAPGNVKRLLEFTSALSSRAESPPVMTQLRKQAARVDALGKTKLSVRAFGDAQRTATQVAQDMYAKGGACGAMKLVSVESGEISDGVFLPLAAPELKESYLVKGSWDETWRFTGCNREARVGMHFAADGWGGATFEAKAAP
jgi:hypothetical protein